MPGTSTTSKRGLRLSGLMPQISMPDSVRTRFALRALNTTLSKRGPSSGERMSASRCATCSASAGPDRLDSMQWSKASSPRRKVFLVIDHHRADIGLDPVQHHSGYEQGSGTISAGTISSGAAAIVTTRAQLKLLRKPRWQNGCRWCDQLRPSGRVAGDYPNTVWNMHAVHACRCVLDHIHISALQRQQVPVARMLLQGCSVLATVEIDGLALRADGGDNIGTENGTEDERKQWAGKHDCVLQVRAEWPEYAQSVPISLMQAVADMLLLWRNRTSCLARLQPRPFVTKATFAVAGCR